MSLLKKVNNSIYKGSGPIRTYSDFVFQKRQPSGFNVVIDRGIVGGDKTEFSPEPPPVYNIQDPDALAYLTKIEMTGNFDIAKAVDEFALGVKADNVWGKINCMHLFIGGTAYRHSIDIITREEGIDTNQIEWLSDDGSIVHTELGSKGNLSALAYGRIYKQVFPLMFNNITCFAFYAEKTSATAGFNVAQVAGSTSFNGSYALMVPGGLATARMKANTTLNYTQSQTKGFIGVGRFNPLSPNTTVVVHPDGTTTGTSTPVGDTYVVGSTSEVYRVHIMRRRTTSSPGYSDDWIRFVMIGEGFTLNDMLSLKSRVDTLQTALGRG